MLSTRELKKAVGLAKKYKIGKLYLVGSILHNSAKNANDYDFAIDDYPKGTFFKFYGELFMAMSKEVDLIDLSGKKTLFDDIVKREAKIIYESK